MATTTKQSPTMTAYPGLPFTPESRGFRLGVLKLRRVGSDPNSPRRPMRSSVAHLSHTGTTCQKYQQYYVHKVPRWRALRAREKCYSIHSFHAPEHKKGNHKWASDTLWKSRLAINHWRWRCCVSPMGPRHPLQRACPRVKLLPEKRSWSQLPASSNPGIPSSPVRVQMSLPFVEVFSLALSQVASIGYLYFELEKRIIPGHLILV